MATYKVSTWDPGDSPADPWGWNVRFTGLSGWRQVRAALRTLRDWGYVEDFSYDITREPVEADR